MKLIIRGEVTPTERIAINAALEAHKNKYTKTGILVTHKIKINNNIYPVEIKNCRKSHLITLRNKRQRL
ncbi:DUF4060 family protein [Providencia rettgeri]|nr:DUF4060 family protein [Providencia rettgeri]EJD6601843.1 DUF4060 family protein [Providencia rettgeri]